MMAETIQNSESSIDNLREIDWVKIQTQEALKGLKANVIDPDKNFYEKTEDGKVKYHMDVVKDYLISIKDKSWVELTRQNTSAWIMAVQIALESMGYEVGHIDGVFANKGAKTSETKSAVIKFQKEHGLKDDGQPGSDTIKKILESLGEEGVKEGVNEGEEEGVKEGENEGEKEGVNELEEISFIDADGYAYKGQVDKKRKRQGKGVLKSPNNGLVTDWEYEGEFNDGNMDGTGKYTRNYGKNSYEGEWKSGKIEKCTSYGNTIDIKYDESGAAYIETETGSKLELTDLKGDVGVFVSVINKIVNIVKNNSGNFKLDLFEADGDKLQADYEKYVWDTDLIRGVNLKYGIKAEDLSTWLNEYRKDVGI